MMKMHALVVSAALIGAALTAAQAAAADLEDRVTHGYANLEGGVKIHYASLGYGPLVDHDPRLSRLLVLVAQADGRRSATSSRSSRSISAATT